jgi:putative phosphoribosyl transferase
MNIHMLMKRRNMLMMLKDRIDGGKKLSEWVLHYKGEPGLIVLGLPRGGVVVANEVAKVLDAPLDIIVPRKVGAPFSPELAVAAVTEDGTVLYNEDLMKELGISVDDIDDTVEQEKKEAMRRMDLYRGDRPPLDLKDKTVLLVDDGIATGYTMKAAIMSARLRGAKKVIVAVPVIPPDKLLTMQELADAVHYVLMPEIFYSVGEFYEEFRQVTDDQVIEILDRAKKP